jgi:DNA-binding PadR family transcriptional regulator
MTMSDQLSLSEWLVLAVVAEQPTHGFAISALTAEDGPLGRIYRVPRPVIYRSLSRLADAGLVVAEGTETSRGPQRTRYAVSESGDRALQAWLEVPAMHVRDVRTHLLVKLALLDRIGADPSRLLRRQRNVLEPIVQALDGEERLAGDFEATLQVWRRVNARAAVEFLAEIDPQG